MNKTTYIYSGLILLVFGLSFFFIGYHNMDLCQNYSRLSLQFNLKIIEYRANGFPINPMDCYNLGVRNLFFGFFTSLVGIFMIGKNINGFDKK